MKPEQKPVPMPEPAPPAQPKISRTNVHVEVVDMAKSEAEPRTDVTIDAEGKIIEDSLSKSVLNILNSGHIERLSFEEDPRNKGSYQSLYHPKLRLLSDGILKRISIQDDLVAAIVRARQNHLSSFGRPRPDRFSTGFILKPKTGLLDRLNEQEREAFSKQVERGVQLLWTCGRTDGVDDDRKQSFSEWLSMCTRSAVVVGRIATEFVYRDEGGQKRFHYFRSVDAGTVYRAAVDSQTQTDTLRSRALHDLERILGRTLRKEPKSEQPMAWVQVIEGTPVQAFTAEEMKVLNFYPVPDIEMDGYPVTPLDTVITAVTTHINITTHNRLYFQNGRASKGMIVINSDDIGPAQVKAMKQQMNASVNGVSNCVAGSSTILTQDLGGGTIADYLGGQSQKSATIWTPSGWQPGLVYKTGSKELTKTVLSNGVVLEVSPDHRFKTVDSDGSLVWKKQCELNRGDYVLANASDVCVDREYLFRGQKITPDLMEVFGWMTGDGHLGPRNLRLYYHHAKEADIRLRHSDILARYGVNMNLVDTYLSEDDRSEICERYGFKSCADKRISSHINDIELANDIRALGFTASRRGVDEIGKTVPAWIFTAPTSLKTAFLRGWFSADGNNAKRRNPALTCCNNYLRKQCKDLLMTLGIRTTLSEGLSVGNFYKTKRPNVLRIKDRGAFFEKIGFIQLHKQPIKEDTGFYDNLPLPVSQRHIKKVQEKHVAPRGKKDLKSSLVFSKRERMDLNEIMRGEACPSKTRLSRICNKAGIEIEKWVKDFHFVKVESVENTGKHVEMYDVAIQEPTHSCSGPECDHPSHAFFVDGVYCHNSWRLPVFTCGLDESITWAPMESGGARDAEFTYLTDQNARVILSAFMMSPEELPGWSYLSRGTNSQSLAECVAPDTLIGVKDLGQVSIGDFVGDLPEKRGVFWTGKSWTEGRAFRSGEKSLVSTELTCGLKINTSPDHRFLVLSDSGETEWRHQSDLRVGDSVLVNKFEPPLGEEAIELSEVEVENYHIDKVSKLEDLGQKIEMFDVEIFDETHAFIANGIVTHNSSNEYRLEANRDLGIRPLLSSFEDFVNSEILPVLDPDLAKKVDFRLVGLEAESAEKEAIRLQQDSFHMTFDDILSKVEKRPIGQTFAAQIPLNEVYKSYLDQYFTVGEILEHFCGRKGASKDPALAYRRDPFFFQWVQLQQQNQMMQQQAAAQQAPQQAPQQQAPADGAQDPQNPPEKTEKQKSDDVQDLSRSIDQAFELMSKSDADISPELRRMLAQHKKTVEFFVDGFAEDARHATTQILDSVKKLKKR